VSLAEVDAPRSSERGLHSGFLRSADRFPERPALEVEGRAWSYAELRDRAAAIAATLQARTPEDGPPLTGVFAYRNATAFAGVLGTLMRGHGYVPLNRTFPIRRTQQMLESAGCRAIVADAESAGQLESILADRTDELLVLLPDEDDVTEIAARLPGHTVLGRRDLAPAGDWQPQPVDPAALAYVLFLSGRKGAPRGIMISHRSVEHYVTTLVARLGITEEDRFSQTSELTFDNSVFDMFVPWQQGACVCCPSAKTLIKPGRYISDSRLTVWFSVPSTAVFMQRFRMLKPGSYPTLRHSLFSCEALPVEVVEAWAAAAPNSTIDNFFGASEVTVDFVGYRWDPERSPRESEDAVLPVGFPLGELDVIVADEELREVAPGAEGEILVGGPQVSAGYLHDPEATAAAFAAPPGRSGRYYRTGFRARRPRSPAEPLVYLGPMRDQVQVLGEPVPLREVEAVLREESGTEAVAAVAWPVAATGAQGVVAFVGDEDADPDALRAALRERLHGQLVPRRVHALSELPVGEGGDFDRDALIRILEEPK